MLMPDIKKTLLPTRPFRYLDIHELDELLNYCQIIHYVKEEMLIQQGKHVNGMYILIEGEAVVSAAVLGREELELAKLGSGDFIGEDSLIHGGLSTVSVIANSNITCLLISADYFAMLSLFFPEIKYKILKAITEEVCNRQHLYYEKITRLMSQYKMLTQSFLRTMVYNCPEPQPVSYKDMHLDILSLRTTEFFCGFLDEEFNEFLQHTTLIKTEKNCILIQEKEQAINFYLILRGAVQVSIAKHNKIAKCAVLGPMEFFGNIAFINQKFSGLAYTTCERALLLKITAADLSYFEKSQIKLWYKLYNNICRSFVLLEDAEDKLLVRLNSELYNR